MTDVEDDPVGFTTHCLILVVSTVVILIDPIGSLEMGAMGTGSFLDLRYRKTYRIHALSE